MEMGGLEMQDGALGDENASRSDLEPQDGASRDEAVSMSDSTEKPLKRGARGPKRQKRYKIAIAVLVILMILGVGFGVYGMVMYVGAEKEIGELLETEVKDEKEIEVSSEDGENVTIVVENGGEKEAQVKALIADFAEEVQEWVKVRNDYGTELKPTVRFLYDTTGLGGILEYRPEGMYISVVLDKSYGLDLDTNNPGYDDSATRDKFIEAFMGLPDRIGMWLVERGFTKYNGDREYLNSETGIICALGGWSWPGIALNCGNIAWINSETAEFSNEVAIKGGFPEGKTLDLDPENLKIEDSQYAPYQTMQGGILGAAGLWYRVSPEADWKWFRGTQAILSCDEYNTEDLKRAYLGQACLNEANQKDEVRL